MRLSKHKEEIDKLKKELKTAHTELDEFRELYKKLATDYSELIKKSINSDKAHHTVMAMTSAIEAVQSLYDAGMNDRAKCIFTQIKFIGLDYFKYAISKEPGGVAYEHVSTKEVGPRFVK